ncbi:putative protein [Geobacter sp. OR-1]|uniref:NUDIX hydrolase n=1 Tax=Geobacter sp. OR-1 TaxID=1266765 RepID=UPI000542280B|nr:CoA pyrophosphatase [Geobacter sp. OR-1]GAM10925.1 putative protein [Geobacter sp. OR-1]
MLTVEQIRHRLATVKIDVQVTDHRSPTAVALILRAGPGGPEVFFIQRAADERDPWSGNIGFPGGRFQEGDKDLRGAAVRETMEEVGIDLESAAEPLGRLSDIVGAHLPVRVACFVYHLHEAPGIALNPEVSDAFWVPLAALADPGNHEQAEVRFDGKTLVTPAIRLPLRDKPVLWGITYRLICQFMAIVRLRSFICDEGSKL